VIGSPSEIRLNTALSPVPHLRLYRFTATRLCYLVFSFQREPENNHFI
jgi:hypothetical protein